MPLPTSLFLLPRSLRSRLPRLFLQEALSDSLFVLSLPIVPRVTVRLLTVCLRNKIQGPETARFMAVSPGNRVEQARSKCCEQEGRRAEGGPLCRHVRVCALGWALPHRACEHERPGTVHECPAKMGACESHARPGLPPCPPSRVPPCPVSVNLPIFPFLFAFALAAPPACLPFPASSWQCQLRSAPGACWSLAPSRSPRLLPSEDLRVRLHPPLLLFIALNWELPEGYLLGSPEDHIEAPRCWQLGRARRWPESRELDVCGAWSTQMHGLDQIGVFTPFLFTKPLKFPSKMFSFQ